MLTDQELNTLDEELKNKIVRVEFDKADGSRRVMMATKNHDLIEISGAPSPKGGGNSKRKAPDEVFVVVDTEIDQWRSFRKDSVVNFSVIE